MVVVLARRRVRVPVSPRAAAVPRQGVLLQAVRLRVSLLARVVRRLESRHRRAVLREVPRAAIHAIHVMIAARRPDPLTHVPLGRQVVRIPAIVARVLVVRIPAIVALDTAVPTPAPPGRQIAEMIAETTDVLMIAGRPVVSAVADRVARRPRIAGVLLVRDRVLARHVARMIGPTAMSGRSALSEFVSLTLQMRSRQISSTSQSPLNCAPCPMDWLKSSLVTWWRQISPCRTRISHSLLSM